MSSPMFIRAAIARSQLATAAHSQPGSMLARNHAFRITTRSLLNQTNNTSSFSTTAVRSAAGSEFRSSSMDSSILTTVRVVRNVLIFSTSSIAIGYFAWSGTHAYLEQYKCPSPAGISSQTRNCLHGAWVREEIAPDPDVAEIYFNKAIEMTRKELVDLYAKKEKAQDGSSSMRREYEIERDAALVEIQNRLARFYARIGQDERAATIWTRLWKLSEKSTPQEEAATKGSSSFSLGSLFGGSSERPLVTRQDGAQFAKSAADCWMRMGEYEMAEEALGWILSSRSSGSSAGSTTTIGEIGLWSTLGALYVRQKKFDYALSLFVKALQSVQAKRNTLTDVSEDKDMWFCREAILMNSIGETLLGAANAATSLPAAQPKQEESKPKSGSSWKLWSSSSSVSSSESATTSTKAPKSAELTKKEEEALGWMQKAIAMAKEKSGKNRDCDECAGLALNTLGLIYEMEGDKDVALAQFKEALIHATLAKDYVGVEDYNKNIARLTELPTTSSEPPTTSSEPASN
ncbi:MAG: hypothetical protein BYD32DRAFT_484513 [Podila humilis]|nr:MAG: hypothetical protein BYD32DRAFT_484513 [Podila humilis]